MIPLPSNEAERLAALHDLRVLRTAPEPHLDAVCRTAAALFAMPIAVVSLIDADRQWFKAKHGLDVTGTAREDAFCSHTILADDVMVVEDARADSRFSASAFVTGGPRIRFYAGAPLILRPGIRLGTLSVLDKHPRRFSEDQCAQLRDLSSVVVAHLRLHEAHARRARDSAERMETILGQLAEGVIVTDALGRITFVNDAAAAIHGVLRLDAGPDAYSETYDPRTPDGAPYAAPELPLARAVRGEHVREARWRIRRPDGADVLAVGSAQPLRAADGRQIGAVLTLRDDTARDAAERFLQDLNTTLASRVDERTREADLARAQAEAASHAKSEFLASMSHEIRTPLNGVIGYADLLLSEPDLAPAARRYGERIRSSGAALLTIVNDVLDFSKIEAGQFEIAPRAFRLAGLIDDAFTIVRGPADAKGIGMNLDLAAGLPAWVVGDEDRLRQVLLNLLNNAIKFTAQGWITLHLAVDRSAGERVWLRFRVSDTGIGIPLAQQHRLFQRFSQVDGSAQRLHGGTGLGLAICKGLVELMEGTTGFESAERQGSTFWFAVPLAVAPEPNPALPRRAPLAVHPARRLLLVEDVPLNRELAVAILKTGGHEVEVAANGADAVAAVQAAAYDLVLMDIQMPVMDGFAATRRIRALDHPAAAVPIVALTANVLPQHIAACLEAGMNDHVGKPFRREALLAAIQRWTGDGSSGGREPAARVF